MEEGNNRRKIRLIEGNAKCRHLKNLSVKGLCDSLRPRNPYPPLTHCKLVYSIQYSFTQRRGDGGEINQREG
jgi:hypothetical protein